MNGIRTFLASVALVLLAVPAEAETPDEFVTDAVDVLAAQLDGRRSELADDQQALYALVDDLLLPRFDRKTAAQQVLARHWRGASDEQKTRFIESFYSILVQRYADGVLEFEPDRIKVLPFRGDATKRTATVKTTVDLEDGTNISVNYTLLNKKPGWMMFDVTIEGVSYIRNFRTEFDAEIKSSSLEDVIVRLEKEAAGEIEIEGESENNE
ncbi:MAG: MlaC/ttg2D family ABC transporter substrate-binding protein [Woeseiaceae bacterium]